MLIRPPLQLLKPIGVRRVMRPPLRVVGSRSHGNPALESALSALGPHDLMNPGKPVPQK